MSRVNPYTSLKDACSKWADEVRFPHTRSMFRFKDITNSDNRWHFYDVRERILAGKQLGYHVEVSVDGDDLIYQYVKDHPKPPWAIR